MFVYDTGMRALRVGMVALTLGSAATTPGCSRNKTGATPAVGVDGPEPAAPTPPQASAPAVPGLKGALGSGKSGGVPFSPSKQGFKFQNYGNDEGYENLTAVEVKRLFGPSVCEAQDEGVCLLTPAAKRWMRTANDAMGDGHCEGLATLALLFDLGKLVPKDFGGESAFTLELEGNKKLQHEVALWFATQSIEPMASAEIRTLTPVQVTERLTAAFRDNSESYTLGIYQPDGTAGHAITPYAVVDKDADVTWILIYDNNYPGEERHIEIHRGDNTWTYFTAANPNEEGDTYTGNAETGTLTLAPTSVRMAKLVCPFCGDVDEEEEEDGGRGRKGRRQLILDGDADLLITDEHGKRLGHANGKLVNEIASAKAIQMKGGPRASKREPVYDLPSGSKLTVTLDGSLLKKKEASDVTMFGAGYSMGIYDVDLEPGEKDTIEFSADGSRIVYTTAKDETPELELDVDTSGADYEFSVYASGESEGQRVELGIDLKKGIFTVEASAKDGGSSYNVEVRRYTAAGEEVFAHKGLATGAKDRMVFKYAAWKGNHQGMDVGIDRGDDGSVDENETLSDDE